MNESDCTCGDPNCTVVERLAVDPEWQRQMAESHKDYDTFQEAIANGGTVHGYRPGEVVDAVRRRALAAEEPHFTQMGEPVRTEDLRP